MYFLTFKFYNAFLLVFIFKETLINWELKKINMKAKAGRIFYVTLDPVDPAVCLPNCTNAASKHSHYYKNIRVDR